MKLSKLTIYELTPNNFFGKDKKGNDYKIGAVGEIWELGIKKITSKELL